jgi:hypothetical protein
MRLYLALIMAVIILATEATPAFVSNKEQYYGADFQAQIESNQLQNKELLSTLFKILSQAHVKKSSSTDELAKNCQQTGEECEQHKSLGYDTARKYLFGQIYLGQSMPGIYDVQEVYCDKKFTDADFGGKTNIGPRMYPVNGTILNTEHTWPQSRFTSRFDPNMQKSDLHHLYPTDSEMNSVRGSLRFGFVDQDSRILKCPQSRVGFRKEDHATVFEPPVNHRGNVARSIFYFSTRYQIKISAAEEAVLREWNKADPVDDFEKQKNDTIENLQGNRNPFIDYPELADHIQSFSF